MDRIEMNTPFLTATISRDPLILAEARVFRVTDNDGDAYWDWSVITNDGRLLAQDRTELDDGEPTAAQLDEFLTVAVSRLQRMGR